MHRAVHAGPAAQDTSRRERPRDQHRGIGTPLNPPPHLHYSIIPSPSYTNPIVMAKAHALTCFEMLKEIKPLFPFSHAWPTGLHSGGVPPKVPVEGKSPADGLPGFSAPTSLERTAAHGT